MYCGILGGQLKRSILQLHDKAKIIYEQDLAPWHTLKLVKSKIEKMKLKVLG